MLSLLNTAATRLFLAAAALMLCHPAPALAIGQDAQARFEKGLALSDKGDVPAAIAVFAGLTEDYPELPEPFNNLAVLYAAQGKYESAKNTLEMAIRTHPGYAVAYENLGDVHAKLAALAYRRALAQEAAPPSVPAKLAQVQRVMTAGSAPPPALVPAVRVPPHVRAVPRTALPVSALPPATADVESAIRAWARAWAARDVNGYLAAYARDFSTDGLSHAEWEARRRARIASAGKIEVKLSDLRITRQGDRAVAVFRQAYRSDSHRAADTKTLTLSLLDGQWRIVAEAAARR